MIIPVSTLRPARPPARPDQRERAGRITADFAAFGPSQKSIPLKMRGQFLIHFRKQRFALYCHGKALYCHGKVTKRKMQRFHAMEKCNGKLYNNINKKTMANRCHFSHQKQDKKRGYLKNHLPKAYQLLLGIRGSNQTRHIKCRSRENYQSRYHVGQTRN